MNARAGSSAAVFMALAAVCLLAPLIGFVVLFGGDEAAACSPPSDEHAAAVVGGLTEEQLRNAATVVAVGTRMGIPRRGVVVALAVASQESRFLNYANDGAGGDLAPDQRGIEASLRLPHQAVGTDHGSLGIFQQQWPWWGPMTELMDPGKAAEKFYTALLNVPGWEGMPVTVAAQAVQRSAFPYAYADDEALALELLADPAIASASASVNAAGLTAGSSCAPSTPVKSGGVVFPLPTGTAHVDRANWGNRGAHWSRGHTGTDLSTACGTPVLAATSGTVIVRTDQPWSGPWLVQVSTGAGQLTTWYAHMQAVTVAHGAAVRAGEQIGEVGSEGNSTGCHLHFEVHPRGGSIYADSIDPTPWLAAQVDPSPRGE